MSEPKMDPEVKERWVAALRSGEFEQCRNQLFDPEENSYCCLGVLWRLEGGEFSESGHNLIAPDYAEATGSYQPIYNLLAQPEETRKALYLINLNDIQGASFPEIADWVEEHL